MMNFIKERENKKLSIINKEFESVYSSINFELNKQLDDVEITYYIEEIKKNISELPQMFTDIKSKRIKRGLIKKLQLFYHSIKYVSDIITDSEENISDDFHIPSSSFESIIYFHNNFSKYYDLSFDGLKENVIDFYNLLEIETRINIENFNYEQQEKLHHLFNIYNDASNENVKTKEDIIKILSSN